MKLINYKSILATVIIFLINTVDLIAKNIPPAPKGSGGFDDDWVVGGSIDTFSPVVFFIALIFGAIMITKIKSKQLDA